MEDAELHETPDPRKCTDPKCVNNKDHNKLVKHYGEECTHQLVSSELLAFSPMRAYCC